MLRSGRKSTLPICGMLCMRIDERVIQMIKGLHHISVYARDTEASLDFYLNTLGFELVDREDDCSFGGFCLIRLGNCWIELITPPEGADYVSWDIPEREPVLSHFGMDVEDVDALYEELKAKGVRIRSNGIDSLAKPLDGGRAFSIYGPCGEVINFYEFRRKVH